MRKRVFLFNIILTFSFYFSQHQDSIQILDEVTIVAKFPLSSEIVSAKEIQDKNLGKDLPNLLDNQTAVISTSDAGNSLGYTGLRIRGADQSRINVTLNGIPLNDSESQNVFWVNMPNVSGALSSVIIQRGVGTSTNGSASFGASLLLNSQKPQDNLSISIESSAGSFNTNKQTISFQSGEIVKGLTTQFSVSKINSDGYIDRAFSDLVSYQFQANYRYQKSEFSLFTFTGKEKTYQAWYGIDAETMQQYPTYNYAGAITDFNGLITGFYTNQTDNYRQTHYQFNWKYQLKSNWKLNATLHYTQGKGYYEEYQNDENLQDYLLTQDITTDIIRRKWLDNDFYGIAVQTSGTIKNFDFHFGIAANQYIGNHFGRLMQAIEISIPQNFEYYRNLSEKNEQSTFAKTILNYNNFQFYADIQLRSIQYTAKEKLHNAQEGAINFKKNYNFINPKIGINYKINNGKLYTFYGIAQREPTRTDILENNQIQPEKLHNIELGIQKNNKNIAFSTNVFAMLYDNQLVLTGALDEVGNPIRENTKSYRLGGETAIQYTVNKYMQLSTNISASINRNKNYYANNQYYGNTPIAFSPNYIQNFIITIFPWNKWQISMANKYVSSQYLTNYKAENNKLDSYFQTDLYINYAIKISEKFQSKLFVNVYNTFNSKIVNNGYYYQIPYYYPQASTNILAGFSINF